MIELWAQYGEILQALATAAVAFAAGWLRYTTARAVAREIQSMRDYLEAQYARKAEVTLLFQSLDTRLRLLERVDRNDS